jgi:1,2-diacylglycerol 3-alpha-glucosyltransferase
MFIIANSFTFNGGSTFVIRIAREYALRGKKLGVLMLVDNIDRGLKAQLDDVADVYFLKDFLRKPFNYLGRSLLSIFFPVRFDDLEIIIKKYGNHIHVMGVFGLLFTARLEKKESYHFNVSAGVYHQYEFMFESTNRLTSYAQELFKSLGTKGAIFLNEANVQSYSSFFGLNYSESVLVPVGIEIPSVVDIKGDSESYKIVSVGNLHPFKTYNLHIIKLMPELLKINKNFSYEIYGEGELQQEAKILIQKLGLEGKVFLKGIIPYSHFKDVLNGAFLFVGSGTAIIEAAALGIPSIIGIESSKEPITYGYLSDIPGFSYNEANDFQKTVSIYGCIESIALDSTKWHEVSIACKIKSDQFSIVHTVDGFEAVESFQNGLGHDVLNRFSNYKLLISFVFLALKDVAGINKSFSQRRNGL